MGWVPIAPEAGPTKMPDPEGPASPPPTVFLSGGHGNWFWREAGCSRWAGPYPCPVTAAEAAQQEQDA